MAKQYVLIIEDNRDLAFVFAESARFFNYDVEVIHDGAQAMQRLGEVTPSVVILDLVLPGLSGPEILAQMRADGRLKGVPVIVATADDDLAKTVRGIADYVLIKPVLFADLRQLVMQTSLRGKGGAGGVTNPPRYAN